MALDTVFTSPHGTFFCGAMPKAPDARDYPLARVPEVAAALEAPLPKRVDRSDLVWKILDQGRIPACVAYSTGYAMQAFEVAEGGKKINFDCLRAYHDVGGDDRSGVPADRLLKKAKADGFPVAASALTFKIAEYRWADDVRTVLAALATGRLAVVACLLPSNLWDASRSTDGPATQSYHQMVVTSYELEDDEGNRGWIKGPNSWGLSWGKDGWYKLSIQYLANKVVQGNYYYAYAISDAPDGDSVPLPTPTPTPVPVPTPKPPPAKVTGLFREQRSVVPISQIVGGGEFILTGEGFGEKCSVTWNAVTLQVAFWDATRIVCRAPESVGQPKLGSIRVKLANGTMVTGPSLTIL